MHEFNAQQWKEIEKLQLDLESVKFALRRNGILPPIPIDENV